MYQHGQIEDTTQDYSGWIMGNFVKDGSPFKTDGFEIKWVVRSKGVSKESKKEHPVPVRTLCILVKGRMKYELYESKKEFLLEKTGQYLFYEPFEYHNATAIEDSVMLVVRWNN